MLRGIYSAIYGEIKVSVSGGYVLQYAGGTSANSRIISDAMKSWSGRKLLDPTMYMAEHITVLLSLYSCLKTKDYFPKVEERLHAKIH